MSPVLIQVSHNRGELNTVYQTYVLSDSEKLLKVVYVQINEIVLDILLNEDKTELLYDHIVVCLSPSFLSGTPERIKLKLISYVPI